MLLVERFSQTQTIEVFLQMFSSMLLLTIYLLEIRGGLKNKGVVSVILSFFLCFYLCLNVFVYLFFFCLSVSGCQCLSLSAYLCLSGYVFVSFCLCVSLSFSVSLSVYYTHLLVPSTCFYKNQIIWLRLRCSLHKILI